MEAAYGLSFFMMISDIFNEKKQPIWIALFFTRKAH